MSSPLSAITKLIDSSHWLPELARFMEEGDKESFLDEMHSKMHFQGKYCILMSAFSDFPVMGVVNYEYIIS